MNKTEKILKYLTDNPLDSTTHTAEILNVSTRMVRYVKEQRRERSKGDTSKILFVDIETAPMEVFVWELYKQRIPITNVIKDWSMLTWSAKWLYNDEIISRKVTTGAATDRNDMEILQDLWWLLDEADIVIAHNAIKFDVRKINARFIENGLRPTSPYQIIDTLKVAQRNFGFSSHKLDYLLSILSTESKKHTSFQLWKDCVNGDEKAIDYMLEYNQHDVVVLEELYLLLRPWIKSHANMGLYTDNEESVCANCGSTSLDWEDTNAYVTPANKYSTYRCLNCGAIGRSRYSQITKEKRKNLTISIAR